MCLNLWDLIYVQICFVSAEMNMNNAASEKANREKMRKEEGMYL